MPFTIILHFILGKAKAFSLGLFPNPLFHTTTDSSEQASVDPRTCTCRYLGKGVGKAVENINQTISPGIAVSLSSTYLAVADSQSRCLMCVKDDSCLMCSFV